MYTATSMLGKAKSNPIYGPITDNRKQRYQIYLRGEHWQNLRKEKLEKNPKCEKCGTYNSLDIHHLQYRDLYDVTLKDLQTLCRLCHDKEHDKANKKKDKISKKERILIQGIQEQKQVWKMFHNATPNYFLIKWFLKEILWICAFECSELDTYKDKEEKTPLRLLCKRNKQRQIDFDKKYKETPHYMSNYISIHY